MTKRVFWITLSSFILAALFVFGCGTNTLQSVSGGKVLTSHPNQYFTAMNGDLVPRNGSGVPTSLAGSLGSSVYRWLKAWVESGYWKAGDLKMHHTYNGTVDCGQGWMIADGDVINETNYDAEHSAGDWDAYVVSSPLDGKHLPNMTDKYPVGKATTTQNGSVAITAVGNASNQINIQHSHTVNSHTHGMDHHHEWADTVGVLTWTSSNSQSAINTVTAGSGGSSAYTNSAVFDYYTSGSKVLTSDSARTSTDATSPGTDNQLSTTQSIQPHSIEVQYCMRVID